MTDGVDERIDSARTVQNENRVVRCVACREDIRPGATICAHCDSPQNWSRHIQDWKNVGSAIAALVPLWTGAFALWTLAFREPVPEVLAASTVCERGRIVVALVNDGDATAVLGQPVLKVVQGKQSQSPNVQLVLESPAQYPYLLTSKQASSVAIKSQVAGLSQPFPTKPANSADACSLVVEVGFRGFKGRAGVASANCPCPLES